MLRSLFIGLWVTCVALGATYGGAYWKAQPSATTTAEHAEKLEVKKLKPITAPIIAGGVLKGYISAEFSILTAPPDKHEKGLDPESYFLDEAFRLIYAESKVDFTHVEKSDLNALTRQITHNVNQRLGVNLVKETLVRNFAFVAREDMPR
jgi:hypothetical protein